MRQIRTAPDWFDRRQGQADSRQDIRRQWERLLHVARYLDQQERAFLEAAVEHSGRISRLSRLTRRAPTSLRRQIRDVIRRLTGRELQTMLAHPGAFTELEKACLREHLVRKHPLSQVADDLDTTVYQVRKTLAAVRAKTDRLSRTDAKTKNRVDLSASCRL